jgi:hypothetical protein
MTDPSGPASPSDNPRTDQAFPPLNEEQLARVGAHGHVREVQRGARLVGAGAQDAPLSVVMTGSIEIVQSRSGVDTPVAEHGPGEFTGEVTMLSGRPSFVTARASVPDGWSSSIAFCHAVHPAHPWPAAGSAASAWLTCGIARALVCKGP